MKEAPVVAGAFVSVFIIAGWGELIGHADLQVWNGDLMVEGLTGLRS
jgi:hypothetical protein